MTAPPPFAWHTPWPAPAKLNLFLHVVGRRPDGYHLLQTVFRFIDRCDWLHFAPRDDDRIVLANPLPNVPPEADLTVRAAHALRREVGETPGVTLHLDKQRPLGGGLGGGSSDAATVLVALNHLWRLGLPRQRLQSLGLALGADVPVFIAGKNAFAEGVGEALTPVDLPAAWYLVVEPDTAVPTAAIFSDSALPRDTPAIHVSEWRPGFGHNDLQSVACRHFPAVADALDTLRQVAPGALMTGSGACLFAEFASADTALEAQAALPAGTRAWVAGGLDRHPLSDVD